MRNAFNISTVFLLTALCLGYSLASESRAQGIDKTVFRFLNLPSSARTAALGGSHVSLNDAGISLFQENPAYLRPDLHRQFAASYVNHLSDINIGFLNGAYSIKDYGTAAAGIRYVNYGTLDRKDEAGNDLGTFQANDLALSMGFSRSDTEHLRYGGSMQLIYSGYDTYQSTGIGFNVGLLYTRPEKKFTLGASLNNAGYQLSAYNNHRGQLPLNLAVGLTKRIKYTPLRISITGTKLNQWPRRTPTERQSPGFGEDLMRHLILGGEFIISDNVFLRVGYNYYKHEQLKTKERLDFAGVSYGIGITIRKIQLDFSRSSYSEIGSLLQLGIQTSL